MSNPAVLQRFPTERYKRFWYPTRPLFTIALGLFLASLGFIGILPMSWALWLAAAFAFDDLPLTPIMSIFTALNNLYHERKSLKSSVTLAVVGLAAITGGLLAFFVLSQISGFMLLINGFIAATGCSPLLISIGAVAGGGIAHLTNKISPFIGIVLGVFLMSLLPIPIPLMVETVFICAAGLAFIASIAVKQGMRAYYKYNYGHTNADGYQLDRSEIEQNQFIEGQANKFKVSKEQFLNLVSFCREKIHEKKQNATFFEEFVGGTRQPITNSFKDIYHGLMNPKCTEEDVVTVKELLRASALSTVEKEMSQHTPPEIVRLKAFTSSATLGSDMKIRTLYHQAQISPGIKDKLIEGFVSDLSL